MKRRPIDARGQVVSLGRELGRGGEGAVYELPAHPERVAKIYHEAPNAAKQAKLRLMAEAIDSPLRNYAAWPEETLHLGADGPVIGFTMQRIEGRLPIHMLYSPAQRRESFAQARFDFLVFVARNIAAAFATLHEHGHVLGDVNQGNVLVGADSRVILIDCDSFQIQVGEALHRCEVGVAHFIPPELQSIASFEDITRTPNHDGFGLALLIFHLLMGGRHPYSGVPLADHIGESLEADIRDFRYAYARDAAQRLIAPPPKSVPIESLPPAIVALFEQAFTQRGVDARPTAQQWVGALDGLRAGLVQCAKRAAHIHAGHAQECAWCVLERRRVRLFGALDKPRFARKSTQPAPPPIPERPAFDIAAMAAAVGKMNPPQRMPVPWYPPLRAPDLEQNIEARAMGLGATVGIFSGFCGMLLVTALDMRAADGMLVFLPLLLLSVVLGFIVSTFGLHYFGRRFREYGEAYSQFRRLHGRLASLAEEINDATAVAAVDEWRNAERALRQFEAKEATALAQFKLDAADGGLRRFLQGKLIEQWREPRLSRLERVRLRAAGIETAADFDRARLVKAHLLSDDARAALSAWKLQLVRDYRRQAPTAAPGLADFHRARAQQRIALQERLGAVYAKLEKSMQRGSLVLAARRNQMAALQAEAMRHHAHCEQLARLLPPPPRRPGSVLP